MAAMLIGLAIAFALLVTAFRLVGAIGRAQGRKSSGDRSNGVGRLLTGMAGAVFRNRH